MEQPQQVKVPDLQLFADQLATKPLKAVDWNEQNILADGNHWGIAEFYLFNPTDWDFGITSISYGDERIRFSLSSDWIYPHRTIKVVMKFLVPRATTWAETIKNLLISDNKLRVEGYYRVRD